MFSFGSYDGLLNVSDERLISLLPPKSYNEKA